MGNKFRDDMKKRTETEQLHYANLSQDESRAFRAQWLNEQIANVKTKHSQSSSWRRIDSTKGKLKTYGRCVVDFGGWSWPDAIRGATNVVAKCTLMGHPWIQQHPQSGLQEFMVLEQGFSEHFEKAWIEFKECALKKAAPAPEKPKDDDEKNDDDTGKHKDDDKKQQPTLQTVNRQASKAKQAYVELSSAFLQMQTKLLTADMAWWNTSPKVTSAKEQFQRLQCKMTEASFEPKCGGGGGGRSLSPNVVVVGGGDCGGGCLSLSAFLCAS